MVLANMNSSLLSLHQSVLEPIFSDWLLVQHLCCLDTAVCNHELRSYFLIILSLSRATDNEDNHTNLIDGFYDWLYSRRLAVNHLALKDGHFPKSDVFLFLFSSKRLIELELSPSKELNGLIEHLSLNNIMKLIVPRCDEPSLVPMLQLLGPKLSDLKIQAWSPSNEIISQIAKYCLNLRRFHCDSLDATDVIPILGSCPIETMRHIPLGQLMQTDTSLNKSVVSLSACSATSNAAFRINKRLYHFTELIFDQANDAMIGLIPHMSTVKQLEFKGEWSVLVNLLLHCENLTSCEFQTETIDENVLVEVMDKFSFQFRRVKFLKPSMTVETVLKVVEKCTLLEELRIDNVQLAHDALFDIVSNLPRLRSLHLGQSMPENLMLHKAVNMDSLVISREVANRSRFNLGYDQDYAAAPALLDFTNSESLSGGSFIQLFQQNPGLTSVSFLGQDLLNNETIKALAMLCPMLKEVCVSNCSAVTHSGLYGLTEACKNLKSIDIRTNNINRAKLSLDRLLQGMANLKAFTILGCSDLESSDLHWIAQHCPVITDVNLSYCDDVRDDDVIALLTGCQRLRYLSLQGCVRITAAVLPTVINRQPKLRRLDLHGVSITEDEFFDVMFTHLSMRSYLITDFDEILWPAVDEMVASVLILKTVFNIIDSTDISVMNWYMRESKHNRSHIYNLHSLNQLQFFNTIVIIIKTESTVVIKCLQGIRIVRYHPGTKNPQPGFRFLHQLQNYHYLSSFKMFLPAFKMFLVVLGL